MLQLPQANIELQDLIFFGRIQIVSTFKDIQLSSLHDC